MGEKIKESYYYKENVEPVFNDIEKIKDDKVREEIRKITDEISKIAEEVDTEERKKELGNYMQKIETILVTYNTSGGLASVSSEVERSQLANNVSNNPISEESTGSSEFKGLISPETGEIYSGVVGTATGVVDKYIKEPIEAGVDAYEDVRENGIVNHLKGEDKTKENGGEIRKEKELEKKEKTNILGSIKSFFKEDELDKIEDISLNTSVNEEDFKQRYDKFLEEVKKSEKFLSLSKEEQEYLIKNLNTLKEETLKNVKNNKEVALNKFDNYFDNLGKQVKNTPDGQKVEITLDGGEKLNFNSKEEAFEFLEYAKKEAYYELEDNISIFLNFSAGLLGNALGIGGNILIFPLNYTFSKGVDYVKNFSENSWGENIFALLPLIISAVFTANFYETVLRRGLKDNFSKYVLSSNSKWGIEKGYVIPDFSKGDLYGAGELIQNLKNEYNERLAILQQLEEKKYSLDPKERLIFQKKLDDVKSYLNINSDTFKKKAYALDLNISNPRRFWWAIRDGFFPKILADKAGTHFNTNYERKEKTKQGLEFVYKNATFDSEGKLDKSNLQFSEEIERMFDYIDSKYTTESERNDVKRRLEKLLNDNKENPKDIDFLKREIYGFVEEGWLTNDEIKAKIQDRLKKIEPPKKDGKGLFEWILESSSYKKDKIMQKVSEIYGKNAPTLFTKGQAELFWLLNEAEKGNLKGYDANSLDFLISQIESGKIEFNRISKPGMVKDILIGGVKYIYDGSSIILTKKFPTIDKYDDLEAKLGLGNDGNGIIAEGARYRQSLKEGKEYFEKNEEFKQLKNIINLSHEFDNGKEIEFQKAIEEIENKGYTIEEARFQVILMSKGYLPTHYTLEILENSFDDVSKKSDLYKDFKSLIENREWIGNKKDLEDAIKTLKNSIKNGGNKILPNNNLDESKFSDDLDKLVEEGKKLSKLDFKNITYGLPFSDNNGEKSLKIDDIKSTEGILFKILGKFDETKLDEFGDKVNGTKKLDFRWDEYLLELKEISGIDFDINTINNRNKILEKIGTEIQLKIQVKLDFVADKNNSLEDRIKIKQEIEKILYGANLNNTTGILELNDIVESRKKLLTNNGVDLQVLIDFEGEVENKKNLGKLNDIKERVKFTLDEYKNSGKISDIDYQTKIQKLDEFTSYNSNIEDDIKQKLGLDEIFSKEIMDGVKQQRILNGNNSLNSQKQNIDIAEKSKQINELFERLQLQLILDGSYDSKKQDFLRLQNKYLNQNNIKNADLVLLESNLKNQFNVLSIKTKKDLKLEIKTKEIIDSSGNKVDFNIDFKFRDVFDKFRTGDLRVKI